MALTRTTKRLVKQLAVAGALVWILLAAFASRSTVSDVEDDTSVDETVRAERKYKGSVTDVGPTKKSRREVLADLRTQLYSLPRPDDQKYAINETLSQRISVTRAIPDNRPPVCHTKTYPLNNSLTISVIIPMYNEAPSILLRTIHSIIERTPSRMLADIIVVDDMSTNENMKQPLSDYIDHLIPKVRLLRLKRKAHLIKARMAGASVARGDILMFQDGHTEMNAGWAEPILDYLSRHPNTIVQPSVDSIDQWTIDYESLSGVTSIWRGVFLWDMRYAWHRTPDKYAVWRSSAADPIPCPVLVGCSIAVRRDYFHEIGGFDTGLDIWGGEQIELSFKAWMCGGRVVILPCSHVGHIYKPWMKSDVNWKKREQAIAKNNMRIGEGWMERYSTYYYASNRIYPFKVVDFDEKDLAEIAEIRKKKERMKCKSFEWYLKNVLPELAEPPPDAQFFGEVDNVASKMCLTISQDGYIGLTADCYLYSRFQEHAEFAFIHSGQMMNLDRCVVLDEYSLIKLLPCDQKQNNGAIRFQLLEGYGQTRGLIKFFPAGVGATELCLEQITNVIKHIHPTEQLPQFKDCDATNSFQQWNVNYQFSYGLVPPPYFDGDKRFAHKVK